MQGFADRLAEKSVEVFPVSDADILDMLWKYRKALDEYWQGPCPEGTERVRWYSTRTILFEESKRITKIINRLS